MIAAAAGTDAAQYSMSASIERQFSVALVVNIATKALARLAGGPFSLARLLKAIIPNLTQDGLERYFGFDVTGRKVVLRLLINIAQLCITEGDTLLTFRLEFDLPMSFIPAEPL